MERREKVVGLARLIEARRGSKRLHKKKAKQAKERAERDREAEEREEEQLREDPEAYREEHGRCPDGYRWDEKESTCVLVDPEKKQEAEDEQDDQERDQREAEKDKEKAKREKMGLQKLGRKKPPGEPGTDVVKRDAGPLTKDKGRALDKTDEQKVEERRARSAKLLSLLDKDVDAYMTEVDRMRDAGLLPDEKTAELLSRTPDPDGLPDRIRNDPVALKKIIRQQDEAREHEERVLRKMDRYLKNYERTKELAEQQGKKVAPLDPLKMFNELEHMYGRSLPRTPKTDEFIAKNKSKLAEGYREAKTKPAEPAYWFKKLFQRITRPLPRWQAKASNHMGSGNVLEQPAGKVVVESTPFPPYLGQAGSSAPVSRQPGGFPPYGKPDPSSKLH